METILKSSLTGAVMGFFGGVILFFLVFLPFVLECKAHRWGGEPNYWPNWYYCDLGALRPILTLGFYGCLIGLALGVIIGMIMRTT